MGQNRLSEEEVHALYQCHAKALVAYACSFGLDFSPAEDIVQQVFLKLLRGETSVPEIPVGYLYRAVRNTCLNHRRDVARELPLGQEGNWLEHRDGDRIAEIALQAALTNLPEEQREVVIMHIWGGLTLEEVAAASATSLSTAASRYRYALDRLRKAFDVVKQAKEKGER